MIGRRDAFIVHCDREGIVRGYLSDEIGVSRLAPPGTPLAGAISGESFHKFLDFLALLREKLAAFDWEIDVCLDERIVRLHFAGSVGVDGLTIFAANTFDAVDALCEELLRINNEQATALRFAAKERSRLGVALPDPKLYEELSELNNELANAQRQLAKQNAELARLNEQKNELFGMAAHDLRNPLGIIAGYAEVLMMRNQDSLPADDLRYIDHIHSSARIMQQLIEEMLDWSQIDAGKLSLALQPMPLALLVDACADLWALAAGRKSIAVVVEDLPDLPPLAIDPGKIAQVLNNLVGNAVKFSPPGTTVRLRLAQDGEAQLVQVIDQGPGLTPAEIAKLFIPFGRGKNQPTGGETSTGLGLAICKRIVEAHGGRIEVAPAPGGGAIFTVRLPQ
jgi:signal transduction histidine kinase